MVEESKLIKEIHFTLRKKQNTLIKFDKILFDNWCKASIYIPEQVAYTLI